VKRIMILILCLLLAVGAQASEWIPEGAAYDPAAEVYIVPGSGERIAMILNEAGLPRYLSGTSDYVPTGEPSYEAALGVYPDALVIESRKETVHGGEALRLYLLHEAFHGSILFADGMVIGRELMFVSCVRDGAITMSGAVAALRVLRPEAELLEVELDDDDGLLLYEGEARIDGQTFEFEMDAATGKLLQWSR